MTVYVDSLFLLNGLINLLLLLGSARVAGAPVRRGRMAAAAAFGGLYAVGCVVPGLEALQGTAARLGVMAAMLLLAFGCGRETVKLGFVFLGLSVAFGGLMLAMLHVFGVSLTLLGGVAYYPVSARVLLLTAAAVYILSRTVFARLCQHTGGELVEAELRCGDRSVRLTALRDTGNTLRDPVTNRGVLVAEWQALRPLLPPEAAAGLTAGQLARPDDLLPRLSAAAPAGKWRLIPYRAVGTDSGLLLAMRCDQIRVGKQVVRGGLVAFSPTPVSDGGAYTALTGGNI